MTSLLLLALQALAQAEALAGELQEVGVERQPVEKRRGQPLVAAEEGRPLRERHRRGGEQADLLVQRREHAEEEVGAQLGEGNEPDLVEDEQVEAQQPLFVAAEPVRRSSSARVRRCSGSTLSSMAKSSCSMIANQNEAIARPPTVNSRST